MIEIKNLDECYALIDAVKNDPSNEELIQRLNDFEFDIVISEPQESEEVFF